MPPVSHLKGKFCLQRENSESGRVIFSAVDFPKCIWRLEIKMKVLPRILYLLQAVPIKLPQSFFNAFKRCCRTFLWAKRSPMLSWDKLIHLKQKGGSRLAAYCPIPQSLSAHKIGGLAPSWGWQRLGQCRKCVPWYSHLSSPLDWHSLNP